KSGQAATTVVHSGHISLEGIHGTVEVPHHAAGFWQQWRAFIGPAILVSVGYMDPGNWGTDLAAGAAYKYGLLWVVGLASLMAIFMLPQTRPNFLEMGRALISPNFRQAGMIYVAIGIIGATVMPHNLYLHSALVQSRKLQKDDASIRSAIRFNVIDSTTALSVAF